MSSWAGQGVALAPFPEQLPATRGEVEAFRTLLPHATVQLGRRGDGSGDAAVADVRHPGSRRHARRDQRAQPNVLSHRAGATEGCANRPTTAGSRCTRCSVCRCEVPLVFLSGCETGAAYESMDDPVKGTAELSLAQAFLSGGRGERHSHALAHRRRGCR